MPWIGFGVSGRSLRLGCGYSVVGIVIVVVVALTLGLVAAALVAGSMLATLWAVLQVVRAGEG